MKKKKHIILTKPESYLRWLDERIMQGRMCPKCKNWWHACKCKR